MRKFFIFLFSLIILLTSGGYVSARSSRTSSSDIYVHGYYRKNGTYVQPYYRTPPDNSKLNNYDCIDYGRCGTSGILPYSSPTPIKTPPNGYTNSYGGFGCNKGYSQNYLNNTCDKIQVPANATLDYIGNSWQCNSGYKKNYISNTCDKVICPANSYVNYGYCLCNTGYYMNYRSNQCERF